jgi:eukaryotic-like serine/threonine-protein kinase
MAAVPPSTSADLLNLCRKSGLFDAGQLDEFLGRAEVPGEPVGAAKVLIQAGLLTKFQAKNLLCGKYRGLRLGPLTLLNQIGKGGMGSVFLCHYGALTEAVAVKFLPEDKAADPGLLQRFLREARAAASLNHPNIIRTHDFNTIGKVHFLVMEYVDGTDLEKVIRTQGALPPAQAADYIRQAARGLKHAHEKGLVHRDIKPANLLVDKQGVVKILDFGLARSFIDGTDRLTEQHDPGVLIGTADFMAPEQILGAPVDGRTDIYALGVTFYTLLTGRPPFAGTTTQKFTAHQYFAPPPLSKVRPSVPPEIRAVVDRMIAKRPADRYQTAQEVIDALAACREREPSTAAEVPPRADASPDRPGTPVSKGLLFAGSVAIGLVCALAAWSLLPRSKGATDSPPDGSQVQPAAGPAENGKEKGTAVHW